MLITEDEKNVRLGAGLRSQSGVTQSRSGKSPCKLAAIERNGHGTNLPQSGELLYATGMSGACGHGVFM